MNQYQYPPCPGQGAPTQNQAPVPGGSFEGNYPGGQGSFSPSAAPQPVWNAASQQAYPTGTGYLPVQYPSAEGVPPFVPQGEAYFQAGAYPAAQPAGYAAYQPPVQAQPAFTPAYVPAAYPGQAYYAPPFAIGQGRDPRLSGAAKTVNRLCLVVLLQTVAAFVFEIPLAALMTWGGIGLYSGTLAFEWLTAVMVPLSTALPFFIYLKIGHKDVADYLKFEKVGFGTALLCVLAGFGVCLLGNYPAFAIQSFFGNFGYSPSSSLSQGSNSWSMFFLEFFTVAVLVPVMEEFAFRGVLFSSLQKHGTGFAVVVSALVFSLVHLDFSNVVFAFIAGLVFAFLYAKTRNLWVTILIHALNNGTAVIGTYGEFLFGKNLAVLIENLLMLVPIVVGLMALVMLLVFKREKLFRRSAEQERMVRPLSAGESASAVVRAPLFWVIVAMMAAYTTALFF